MTIIESTPNSDLYIEITDRPHIVAASPSVMGGTVSGGAADILDKLRDVGESVGETCATLFNSAIHKLSAARPEELTIEFGIALGGEGGIPFVTKGHVEGTFKVTATWKPQNVAAPTAAATPPETSSSQTR